MGDLLLEESGFMIMYKIRRTRRLVGNQRKAFKIYFFTGTADQYGAFCDLRTDADGTMRRGVDCPFIEVDGGLEPASFEVRAPSED